MIARLRRIFTAITAAAIGLACSHEPNSNELGEDVGPIGPNGEVRMYAADQDSSGTRLCFAAPDLKLAPGTPVTVVHSTFPQYSIPGKLGRRSRSPCFPPAIDSVDSMAYVVDAPGDTLGRHGVPIIVIGKLPDAVMRGDTVTLAIEAGQTPWRFRTCASEEGIHATAWSGIPLAAPRRWHAYYYLGYDVKPNCTAADSAPDSASGT